MCGDESHVYDDECFHLKYISQFERNPHLETTIRARFNPKHVDERARVVQEVASKIFQTVCCRWHVRRRGGVGPDTGKSFGKVRRRKVSTIVIIILLELPHEMIWLDR